MKKWLKKLWREVREWLEEATGRRPRTEARTIFRGARVWNPLPANGGDD